MRWKPENTKNKFLLYSQTLQINNHMIINRTQLGRYNYDTLMLFKGIINFPYEASTMSIFEQISSEIPLFFPSKKYLKHLWENNIIKNQMNYWIHNKTGIIPNYLKETQNYDFWIEKADYYDIDGVYYFDSFEHLYQMLEHFKDELYEVRKEFIRKRKIKIINDYKQILNNK